MSDPVERLTPEAYRAWLAKHNMDHKGASKFFGVSTTTTMRWELGLSPIPYVLARLVHYMERLNESPGTEYEIVRKEPKKKVIDLELEAMTPHWQAAIDAARAKKAAEDAKK